MKAIKTVLSPLIFSANRSASTLGRILIFCALATIFSVAQNTKKPEPPKTAPEPTKPASEPASQTAPNNLPPLQVQGSEALHHLNQVISWYRHSTTGIQAVGLPTDAIYQDNTQSLGAQAVRLAFQSAKAESALIGAQEKTEADNQTPGQTSQQQRLAQLDAKTTARIDQLNSQIDDLNAQISKTRGSKKQDLVSQRDAVQGQLELQKALLDAIQKMMSFIETNGEAVSGLEGGINQLAKSIPEVLGTDRKSVV